MSYCISYILYLHLICVCVYLCVFDIIFKNKKSIDDLKKALWPLVTFRTQQIKLKDGGIIFIISDSIIPTQHGSKYHLCKHIHPLAYPLFISDPSLLNEINVNGLSFLIGNEVTKKYTQHYNQKIFMNFDYTA